MGKTSFINRITKGYFMDNLSSTLGVDFQVKTFRVDERNIAIQLWDTAGQVRHIISCETYYLLMLKNMIDLQMYNHILHLPSD